MKYNDFGINLARKRTEAKLSAYELSLRIGKNTTYIHKVESRKLSPNLKVVFQICEVLNIEPVELFKPANDKSE